MTAQITRAFAGDLHIRADGEGRTISGIVVPFDTVARVSDGGPAYDERFAFGSFGKTIKERGDRVKLLLQHDHREPIGRAVLLREDTAGLYGEFRVSAVPAGDQAIELVRDGVLDSFSVGFAAIKHTRDGDVTVRTEVALREASLVTFPAYDTARVLALRAALDGLPADERDALLRDITTPDTTAAVLQDGQPGRSADEPVLDHSARLHIRWQAFRLALRERGIRP